MRIQYVWVIAAVVSFACSDQGPDNAGTVLITTDHASYGRSQTITFTVRNLHGPTAYTGHCNQRLGYSILKQENGSWQVVGERNLICLAIYLSGSKAIVVGQPYTDTLTVTSSGTYRLQMGVGWNPNQAMDNDLFSNIFLVQ